MVTCEIPVVENGRLVSGHEKVYHYQAKADLECLEGFDLQGSSTITCGPNNDWEPQIPTCVKGDFPEVEFQNLENVNPANQAVPPPVSISTPGKPSANSTPPPKDNKEYGGGLIVLMVLQQVLALQ
ncbi:membrane cofactor protein-like [Pipistrellus kuhlii]|uniref:membrane cofactor protein-like n=1 Tax=Pipistrellus kuhlii TaxID=59472 RepID=UPI001E26EE52|nr:membrane cofactor protein-like [Pipistrellus kuhlii]